MSYPGELVQGEGWELGWIGEVRGCKILARHSVGHTLILNILVKGLPNGAVPLCGTEEWGLSFGPTHDYFTVISTVLLGFR